MAFDGWEMNDVLAEEILGDGDPFRIDFIEDEHLRLRFIINPLDVRFFEVVKYRYVVPFKNRDVIVEVFTLERVGDNGLILNAGDVVVPGILQRKDGSLPSATEWCWPRETENATKYYPSGSSWILVQGFGEPGKFHHPFDIGENVFGCYFNDGNF